MKATSERLLDLASRFEKLRPFNADILNIGDEQHPQFNNDSLGADFGRLAGEAERLLSLKTPWMFYLFKHNGDANKTPLTPAPIKMISEGETKTLGMAVRHRIENVPGASAVLLRVLADNMEIDRPRGQDKSNKDRSLTTSMIAERACCSTDTVRNAIHNGHLEAQAPANKQGRASFSAWQSDVDRWIKCGKPAGKSQSANKSRND